MTREDDYTRTEADAAAAAYALGRHEAITDGPGDQSPNPLLDQPDARLLPDLWGLPDPKPAAPLDLPAEPPF